jgi:hypothetical protein
VTVCHLCGHRAPSGWCRGRAVAFCTYRARLRLGVPRFQALKLLELDKATMSGRWAA